MSSEIQKLLQLNPLKKSSELQANEIALSVKSESHVALDSLRPNTTPTRDFTLHWLWIHFSAEHKRRTNSFKPLPYMTHKTNLALFLNLIGDATVFFLTFAFTHHIFEPLWFQRFSFVGWKRRFDENGASLPSPGLELNLLYLICSIFDTTVAMMLEKLAWRLKQFSYEEGSLLLRIRLSSTKFAHRKIWLKLHEKNCSN